MKPLKAVVAARHDRTDPHGVRLRRLQAAAARRTRRRRRPDDGQGRSSSTCSTWCPSRPSRSTTSASGTSRDVSLDGYTAVVDAGDAQRRRAARQRGRRDPPDQPARREVRLPRGSRPRRASANRAPERRRDPARAQSGRNPEVEEVLGALSLLLNGGGVGQLKTITRELNLALEGREGAATVGAAAGPLASWSSSTTTRPTSSTRSRSSTGSRSAIREEQPTIDAALEELPSALDSIDRQRDDLVTMLESLDDLSEVGVKVIRASKDATIDSLEALDPVLTQLAASGDNFTKAFHVFLTYPFVDEVVGRDPQVARNLHMGDYTNLSITLEIDLSQGTTGLPTLPTNLPTQIDPTVIVNNVLDVPAPAATSPARPARRSSRRPTTCSSSRRSARRSATRTRTSAAAQRSSQPCRCPPTTTSVPGVPVAAADAAAPCPGLGRAGTQERTARGTRRIGELMDVLRPGPRQPARPRDGAAMITRRTKLQLLVFAIITLVGVTLRRRPLRPPRPGLHRRHLHRGRPLRRLRRRVRRGRGVLPRRPDRRGVRDGPHRRGRRHPPRHRQRAGPDPGRHASRWSATGPRWGSSTSSCSRRSTTGPSSRTDSEIDVDRTRTPIQTDTLLTNLSDTVRSVDERGPPDRHHRVRCGLRRGGRRTSRRSSTPATRSSTPPTPTSRSPPS